MSDLTNVLLEEWSKIPINTLLNLVESLPRTVEAVIAAKGGLTSYLTLWIKNGMSLQFICMSDTFGDIVYEYDPNFSWSVEHINNCIERKSTS